MLRASILEPPGLDFGASSLDFEASRLDCGASRPPTFLCLCFPHSATPLGKRGTVSCLGFIPFVFLPSSTALPKCGRRRCPPLGAFNPPPTEGVRSVLDIQPHRFQIRPDNITKGESERPSSLCKPRLLFPSLFLSPGGWGPPEPTTKFPPSASCWVSWADF